MAEIHYRQSFAGQVAFITGAANGIGRATALAFKDRIHRGNGDQVRKQTQNFLC